MADPIAPTRVEVWQRCPQLFDYEKRWTPRDTEWTPNLTLGIAIHAGLAAHYQAPGLTDPFTVADTVLGVEFEAAGSGVEKWTLGGLQQHVRNGVEIGLKLNVVPPGCQVVAVEQGFLSCRPDLIHREPEGLVVTDWKVAFELKQQWEAKRLEEYNTSWQLLHDAWAASTHFAENVVRAQIGLIILTPKPKGTRHPIPTPSERLAQWFTQAHDLWQVMGVARPWMNTGSCTKPWRCKFYELCHVYFGNEKLAEALYERIGGSGGIVSSPSTQGISEGKT